MIRRILVPLDGSELAERALPIVGSISARKGFTISMATFGQTMSPKARNPTLLAPSHRA
jgi:nucleotide-binding universal stress UspA family protein